MTPTELVDIRQSPGPKQVFGTDVGSNKGWRSDESVVQGTAPLRKDITVPSTVWSWNHALGFTPLIQVFTTVGEQMLAYSQNVDTNNLTITHLYAATGYILIR